MELLAGSFQHSAVKLNRNDEPLAKPEVYLKERRIKIMRKYFYIIMAATLLFPIGASAQTKSPLKSYWCAGERTDYFTTGTAGGQSAAGDWDCTFKRTEGYVFTTEQPGTVPLELYWSDDRTDNATIASEETKAELLASGYRKTASEGYIYSTEQPGTVPLKLFFNKDMNEYYSTTPQTGEKAAVDEGFVFVRIEGYIMPAEGGNSPK